LHFEIECGNLKIISRKKIRALFSPIHICLVLTREYFRVDLWMMYNNDKSGLILFAAAILRI